MSLEFTTNYAEILLKIQEINPVAYAKDRNYLSGHVTKLSPYISRGVISTNQIVSSLKQRGFSWKECEKLVQELSWRDYFQRVWQHRKDDLDKELLNVQTGISNHQIPFAVVNACTGIDAVDEGIVQLVKTGYMHNHLRMYTACVVCNIGNSHWLLPAKWMYYYLLDADWASNACSWQWVCGAFSNKKYFANQENINKFCHTSQKGTFLDVAYEAFDLMPAPDVLKKSVTPELCFVLPESLALGETEFNDVLIYNWYNLDPSWHSDNRFERILLLEPSVFFKYPISQHSFEFMLELAKNISGLKAFVGEFKDLQMLRPNARFIFKEHPLNNYYGLEEPRDFIVTDVNGYFRGFFPYWNKISRIIERSWYAE